jgi:hypothetical protein
LGWLGSETGAESRFALANFAQGKLSFMLDLSAQNRMPAADPNLVTQTFGDDCQPDHTNTGAVKQQLFP